MSNTVTIEGLEACLAGLRAWALDTQGAGRAAIQAEAEDILKASKEEVPVATGALKKSGHVEPQSDGALLPFAEIIYDAPHAFIVHEDLNLRHEPPTKAHYLVDPFNRALPGMPDRIAARIRQGGGGEA